MNVAEIIAQHEIELRKIAGKLNDLYEDRIYADAFSQTNARIYHLEEDRRALEDVVRALKFVGPVPTPEMQAERSAEQWYKREHERATKRKVLVDKALGEQNE